MSIVGPQFIIPYYIYFCSILSAEFMRAAIHDAGDTDVAIISKAKARASISLNGKDDEVSSSEMFQIESQLLGFHVFKSIT